MIRLTHDEVVILALSGFMAYTSYLELCDCHGHPPLSEPGLQARFAALQANERARVAAKPVALAAPAAPAAPIWGAPPAGKRKVATAELMQALASLATNNVVAPTPAVHCSIEEYNKQARQASIADSFGLSPAQAWPFALPVAQPSPTGDADSDDDDGDSHHLRRLNPPDPSRSKQAKPPARPDRQIPDSGDDDSDDLFDFGSGK